MARPKLYSDYQLRKAYYFHCVTDGKTKPHYTEDEIRVYLNLSYASYVRQLMAQKSLYYSDKKNMESLLEEFKDVQSLAHDENNSMVKSADALAERYLGGYYTEESLQNLLNLATTLTELEKSCHGLSITQKQLIAEIKTQTEYLAKLQKHYSEQIITNLFLPIKNPKAKGIVNLPSLLEKLNAIQVNVNKIIDFIDIDDEQQPVPTAPIPVPVSVGTPIPQMSAASFNTTTSGMPVPKAVTPIPENKK